MTRADLARLSGRLEGEMVLSVYIARENEDPGRGEEWRRRLAVALDALRADVAVTSPAELPGLERAGGWVMDVAAPFGRILPHEGWCAFATADRLVHAASLQFRPRELVRWRQGLYGAPFVRTLKGTRPVVLGVVDRWHAHIYRYRDGQLSQPIELEVEQAVADASDVGVAKRATARSGTRGMTATDYAQRSQTEESRRLRMETADAIEAACGEDGVAVLGGTREAAAALIKELDARMPGRVAEVGELSFDMPRDGLVAHLREAASQLTERRQEELLAKSEDPRYGSGGWNATYRALAAGAVDTLLVARDMISEAPDDAERLVRLALAQGADVEEVGGALGEGLMARHGGVSARLRFVPASLRA